MSRCTLGPDSESCGLDQSCRSFCKANFQNPAHLPPSTTTHSRRLLFVGAADDAPVSSVADALALFAARRSRDAAGAPQCPTRACQLRYLDYFHTALRRPPACRPVRLTAIGLLTVPVVDGDLFRPVVRISGPDFASYVTAFGERVEWGGGCWGGAVGGGGRGIRVGIEETLHLELTDMQVDNLEYGIRQHIAGEDRGGRI